MANFEELNTFALQVKELLLADEDLKKLLFYSDEDALSPSNPVPDDDDIWYKRMFPQERYVDAETTNKAFVNFYFKRSSNYNKNNYFASVDLVFDIIVHLTADEINEGLRRLSLLSLIDVKFNRVHYDIVGLDKIYPKGWDERPYSKEYYGIRTIYKLSMKTPAC